MIFGNLSKLSRPELVISERVARKPALFLTSLFWDPKSLDFPYRRSFTCQNIALKDKGKLPQCLINTP
jgi:hypothetical protein